MAPGTPSWLNLDFVERILRNSENDNSIRLIDISSKPAAGKGDNYTSDLIRVSIEFSRGKDDRREKKSIIFKVAPTEGKKKDLILETGLFDVELSMMTNTLKKMNELLGKKCKLNASLLYLQKENPLIFVMEDLAALGFSMANRQTGLNLDHCSLALRRLAKFHASSVALCEKEPEQKQLYRKGMFSKEYPPEIMLFFVNGMQALTEVAKNWPDIEPKHVEKLQRFGDNIEGKGLKATEYRENSFNVINHGDFWVNNMLFRYNDEGKPIDHIFVDFQIALYTSPAIDLLYFFNTSVSDVVFMNHKEELVQEYHSTLVDAMKELGCKTAAPSLLELKREMSDRIDYGIIASFTIMPIMFADKDDAMEITEMLSTDGGYKNPALTSELGRNVLTKRILLYDGMGLLDP